MNILALHFTAFGPFTDRVLDFGLGNAGLHVIFGPNEAGKSSALRALHAALYGIPPRTSDNFLHPYDALRIGGRLRHSSGAEITFVRRKRDKNTLLRPDGTPLDDRALDRFLGGENREKFEMFWGIDHARLVQGGSEILEGKGDLGTILFAAGSGASRLGGVRKKMEEEAKALYVPRGQNPPINQGVSRLRELQKGQRDTTVSANDWLRQEQASRGAAETVTRLSNRLQDLAREQARLKRVKRILPTLAERKNLQERLAALTDAVRLADDFPTRRQEAEAELRTALQNIDRTKNELREQNELVERLGPPPPLLAESEAVNRLHVDLGNHRKARSDRPRLIGQRDEQLTLAKRLLAEWRPEVGVEGFAALRGFVGRRARIQKLVTEQGKMEERLASALRSHQNAQEQADTLAREASSLPPQRDPERLIAEIEAAQRQGDAEAQRTKGAQLVLKLQSQRDTLGEKLGISVSGMEKIGGLRVPTALAIARFEQQEKEFDDEARAAKIGRQKLVKTVRELATKIETLRTKQSVPTEQDLVLARTRRDTAFGLLRSQWEGGRGGVAEAHELLGEGNLLDLYPAAVVEADGVSDRLRSEAKSVAELAQQMEERERAQREIEEVDAASLRLEKAVVERDAEWREAWKTVSDLPPQIHDARTWREDFERLLKQLQDVTEAQQAQQAVETQIGNRMAGLHAAITALEPVQDRADSLAATLTSAERLRKCIEAEKLTRSEHARRTRENVQAVMDAEKAKRAAQAEIAAWQGQWTEATRGLLAGDAAPPDDALAALEVIGQVAHALDKMEEYKTRIAGIDRDAEQFLGNVRALAVRLDETVEQEREDPWVDSVHRLLTEALQEEERRRQAREQQARLEADSKKYGDAMRAAQSALAALRGEARCSPDADLAVVEQRSTELRTCHTEIEKIGQNLVQSGDGASITELEAEATSADRDTLDARMDEIGVCLSEMERDLGAARDAQATAQAQLKLLQGPSAASEKSEEIEATLAKLREDVIQYARLRVASTLLARRMEDYRRRNQAPLLLRAGALFREMTLGSFERLEADMDNNRPILTGVRPNGKRVPAHDGMMSEGTRDQLFLALRLAAVEASCASGEPLPFVVDDILMQFDDARTSAGLRVLAEVAAHTQVVLFTHHRHVRASAEAMNMPTHVVVHDL